MKKLSLLALVTVFCGLILQAPIPAQSNSASSKLPPAIQLLSPSICGKGVFQFWLGDQQIGREEFEVTCRPEGGYGSSAHTDFKVPGASVDLKSTLEVNESGEPLSSSTKGTVNGQPHDQSIVVKSGMAVVTTSGSSKELPFAKGTSFLGGNLFHMFQFILVRYDVAKGGSQEFPIFPEMKAKVERVARDELHPTGIAASPAPFVFDRYGVTVGSSGVTAWVDPKGRIATIAVPLQNFAVVREEYVSFIPSFKAILSAKMKETELDYTAPASAPFKAEEVTVEAKGFTLAGTLLVPKTGTPPYPVVITITGSGQQTRDEYLPLPGLEKYRPFRQIAEALASRGIAVLRVDDRGTGHSKGGDTLKVSTSANFADDVRAQVDFLRERRDVDPNRVALLGHSEGGMIAPMVASSDPRIAGIVLLAGPGKRGEEIIAYQANQGLEGDPTLTEETRAKARAAQQEARRKDAAAETSAAGQTQTAWMRYFLKYDPLPVIKKVRQPILILQGELDRQVTADQAELLAKAAREAGNRDVTSRVFPGLNHLFLPSKTGSVIEYSSLSTNSIPDEVMKELTDWLLGRLKVAK